MQKRLTKLGFAMALEPISKFTGIDPHALDSDDDYHGEGNSNAAALLRNTASSHTAGRSVHTSGRPETASSGAFFHRPMKRQRLDSPLPNKLQVDHPSSRDAMPPPPKLMSRMSSVRKMFPSLRKKFSNTCSTPVMEDISESTGDICVYADEHIQDTTIDQYPSRNQFRSETPYMSGALPIEQSSQDLERRGSQLLTSVGMHDNRSEFTFRTSSPIKLDRQNANRRSQLPTEPSYIRLMDGLSSDNGVELGLKDPRENTAADYQHEGGSRQVMRNLWDDHNFQEAGYQKRWDFGHPSMYQSPQESSTSVDFCQQHAGQHQTNGHTNRTYNQPFGPATPASKRQQNPGHQMESVVSPYFRDGRNQAQIYPEPGLAERQGSSIHFGAYLSQKARMGDPQPGWHEPRGLNGLSFFDSPVDSRNEPIETGHQRRIIEIDSMSTSDHFETRRINSRGFITRPEPGRSPYSNDSAYSSLQNKSFPVRQAPAHVRASLNLPYRNRPTYSRIERVPSSMPSSVPRRSPTRMQPQWKNLQRAGVRSSRNALGSSTQHGLAASTRNHFQGSVGRNVRR